MGSPHISPSAPLIDYAVSTFTPPGEVESGDQYAVVNTSFGAVIAVADGIGHGPQAAAASRAALAAVEIHAEESVVSLMQHCHEDMKLTRGAVMSVAALNGRDDTLTWLSVGNVDVVLVRANKGAGASQEEVLMRNGVVGHQLPALQAIQLPVAPGDLLVFTTDGIRLDFSPEQALGVPVQHIADRICSRHCKGNDDALVLVARYRGGGA